MSANSHRDAVVFAQHLVGRDDIGRLGVTVVRAVVPEPEDPVVPEILGLLGDLGKRVRGQVTAADEDAVSETRVAEITDEMVERAAEAIFDLPGEQVGDYKWAEMLAEDPERADMWRNDARVVLAAALEPAPEKRGVE